MAAQRRDYVGEQRTRRLQRRGYNHKRILRCIHGTGESGQYARHNIANDYILFFVYAYIYGCSLIARKQCRLPAYDRGFIVTEI